jgi:hypothetical protein
MATPRPWVLHVPASPLTYKGAPALLFATPSLSLKPLPPGYYHAVLVGSRFAAPRLVGFDRVTAAYPAPLFEDPRLRLHMVQGRRAHVRFSLLAPTGGSFHPLFLITGALVASATGLGKGARFSSLAQLFSCQLLRRHLISLGSPVCDLWVRGGLTNFSLLWRHVRQPLDEVF